MKELKEQKDFNPPGESKGRLESIFESPIYKELKDIATSFPAKLGGEIAKP